MVKFAELKLSNSIIKATEQMGFVEATPIQEQAIPLAMEGKDLIGQAQTGTGKTVAFGIPMVEAIRPTSRTIQGIVVVPTRELAVQVAAELTRIGQIRGVRTIPIYGGQDFWTQIKALSTSPQIITGTPGRLLEHMRRQSIKTSDIKIAVLDEADIMLDMGFIDEVEKILKRLPDKRQTMLFSATISPPLQKLAQQYMYDPVKIVLEEKSITVPTTEQYWVEAPERLKFEVLTRLIEKDQPDLAIVFVRTKIRADELATALTENGYPAIGIHGDLLQAKRESTLGKFKAGKVSILVATEVAARGLDIQGVTHIYNFDIPQDPDSYVHRIGRTGRAGNVGTATTLVGSGEVKLMNSIEKAIDHKITKVPVPSGAEATEKKLHDTMDKLQTEIENTDISFYKDYAESLLKTSDPATIISAALRLMTRMEEKTPVRLSEIPKRGAPAKKTEKGAKGKSTGYGKKGGRSKGYGYKDEGPREIEGGHGKTGGYGKESGHGKSGGYGKPGGQKSTGGYGKPGGQKSTGGYGKESGHGKTGGQRKAPGQGPKGGAFKQFVKKKSAGTKSDRKR